LQISPHLESETVKSLLKTASHGNTPCNLSL
jgi:hypothetical protein